MAFGAPELALPKLIQAPKETAWRPWCPTTDYPIRQASSDARDAWHAAEPPPRIRDRATSHADPIAHANRAQHPVNTTRTCNTLPKGYRSTGEVSWWLWTAARSPRSSWEALPIRWRNRRVRP